MSLSWHSSRPTVMLSWPLPNFTIMLCWPTGVGEELSSDLLQFSSSMELLCTGIARELSTT